VISLVGAISGKSLKLLPCHNLKLKCTKFDFGCGSAPDPAGGAYSAPPGPLAGFKGPTSKGEEGRGKEWKGRGGEGRGKKGQKGREGKEKREGKERGKGKEVEGGGGRYSLARPSA